MTRVVVVAGASDGIGAAIARRLARTRAGAPVALVLGARDLVRLQAVAGECEALGAQALAVRTDVADPAQCRALIAAAAARFGRIDALVNNAGRSAHALFEDVAVTIAYPGVVDTRIRYRGFNALGEEAGKSGLREQGAMPVEECARLIVEGMDRRRREVVMTARGKLGRLMKLLAPGLVEKMAMAALKEDVKPR